MLAFLADVSIPQSMLALARQRGHSAVHVRDYEMARASDGEILQRASEEGRIVLTVDVDFARETAFAPYPVIGVILFRLKNPPAALLTEAFKQVLDTLTEEDLLSHFVTVEPRRIRRRELPIRK
jgi:predicted nuclease of predicted toxin-antitoxin system